MTPGRAHERSRRLLAAFFIGAGVNHFVNPRSYRAIVPPRCQDDAKRWCRSAAWRRCVGGVGVLLPRDAPRAGLG